MGKVKKIDASKSVDEVSVSGLSLQQAANVIIGVDERKDSLKDST